MEVLEEGEERHGGFHGAEAEGVEGFSFASVVRFSKKPNELIPISLIQVILQNPLFRSSFVSIQTHKPPDLRILIHYVFKTSPILLPSSSVLRFSQKPNE